MAEIPPFRGAANGTRTRDPQLGKLMLYQLSYCRIFWWCKCMFYFGNKQFLV